MYVTLLRLPYACSHPNLLYFDIYILTIQLDCIFGGGGSCSPVPLIVAKVQRIYALSTVFVL